MFKKDCPNFVEGVNGKINSGQTPLYNCIAFSLWSEVQYIWPDLAEEYAWPQNVQRLPNLANFLAFYMMCGFEITNTHQLEQSWEKVVIFEESGEVAHAARQLADGSWVSKVGDLVDVIHYNLNAVSDGVNGRPSAVVRRPRNNLPPVLPRMHPPLSTLVNSSGTPLTKLIII